MSTIIKFNPMVNIPVVASNVTMAVYEGSSANSVPYVVTQSGNPVTPSSLGIVSNPSNGTAHATGSVLYYTPKPGYSGTDSFTYNAVYNGSTSNTATVSITVNATEGTVMLSWSDDGGHNWSNRVITSSGFTGQTAQRVIFHRLGSTRRNTGLDRIFEISGDDYNQVALVGASINDG